LTTRSGFTLKVQVQQMLAQDRRVNLRLMAEELGISKDMVHTIVCEDWQMWRQSKNV
jgi:hypothetical protein